MMSSHSNRTCVAPRAYSAAIGDALCPSDTADHQSMERAEDQRHLSVSISASSQCSSMPSAIAHQCHISVPISATSIPHISAHLSCLSVSPISASQCHLSMPVSAT
ncbi:unnamed protein product [Staurois parvus]|uniref:Uncharacterized protein n=2 Tax=Staurois parvus TaxID=386267 RepID=A0ABN9C449_9NEOB|nr:unnamed protein product [Staurois parvus]